MVALNERQDDWIPVLVTLKQCFNQYPTITGFSSDASKGGKIIGRNSSFLDGNFLEAINLSLNGKFVQKYNHASLKNRKNFHFITFFPD